MNKFLAVIRREYVERVRTKMFILMTILGPIMLAVFTVVPGLLFSIKTGGPTRIAIVDQTDRLAGRVSRVILDDDDEERSKANANNAAVAAEKAMNSNLQERAQNVGRTLKGNCEIEQVPSHGRALEDVQRELNARISREELDGYIVLPKDILTDGKAQYYGRNTGDVFTNGQLERRLSQAVREQRMADENISEERVRDLSRPVEMSIKPVNAKGEVGAEDNSGTNFIFVFVLGFLIYISIIMYGQLILAAVIEEKETRIAEILFSSVRSFTLMIGKLVGVSLVALTQLAIWGLAFAVFAVYGISMLKQSGVPFSLPSAPWYVVIYFFLFFLLGYYIYSTLYALVGSMVTTAQEGGQMAMPVLFLLMMGFYVSFIVIRSPNSSFAFWTSMIPFFSPIVMLVRIITQTPPFWQIALSLLIGFGTVVALVWLASRIYRIGMLMYGKRASIPEVMRWVRQS
ncbi:MAG: ABC transporter permease [Acidobacteria bacterium]|nr:ABC transporter permease [Acidobacteriota bacterium]